MSSTKYLSFVETTAASIAGLLGNSYLSLRSTSKKYSPEVVERVLGRTESLLAPALAQVQKSTAYVLQAADGTVDSGVTYASSAVSSTKTTLSSWLGKASVEKFSAVTASTAQAVSGAVEQVKSEGLVAAASKAADAAWSYASGLTGAVVSTTKAKAADAHKSVHDTMQTVYDSEAVKAARSKCATAASCVTGQYAAVHDKVVAQESYATLYTRIVDLGRWIAAQPIVVMPAESAFRLAYPHVQGVVDPILDKAQPYVKAVEEHLRPQAAPVRP